MSSKATLDDSPTLNDTALDDLTATRRCAEAMGISTWDEFGWPYCKTFGPNVEQYAPIRNDAQAMALVNRFGLGFDRNIILGEWHVIMVDERSVVKNQGADADLNRAIVYCVAKMKAAIREGGAPIAKESAA